MSVVQEPRTEPGASSVEGEQRDAGAGVASPRHTSSKLRDSDGRVKESSMDSKSPDEGLTMEAVSTVQWDTDGVRGEVQRHTTRVLIRDRDPSYTKYVLTSRTTSRDSLFSTPSSEDAPSLEGGVPSWVSRSAQYEEAEEDHAPGRFRLRSHQYQEHISTMKGEAAAVCVWCSSGGTEALVSRSPVRLGSGGDVCGLPVNKGIVAGMSVALSVESIYEDSLSAGNCDISYDGVTFGR